MSTLKTTANGSTRLALKVLSTPFFPFLQRALQIEMLYSWFYSNQIWIAVGGESSKWVREGAGGKSVPTTSDGVRKGLTPVPPSWGRFIVPVPLYTDSFWNCMSNHFPILSWFNSILEIRSIQHMKHTVSTLWFFLLVGSNYLPARSVTR